MALNEERYRDEARRLIGLLVAEARRKHMSIRSLEKKVGVGPSFLTKVVSGKVIPQMRHLLMLCDALDLPWDQFFAMARPESGEEEPADLTARMLEVLYKYGLLPRPDPAAGQRAARRNVASPGGCPGEVPAEACPPAMENGERGASRPRPDLGQASSAPWQVQLASLQAQLASVQVELARAQVGLASLQVGLVSGQVELVSGQVAYASGQVAYASGQVELASGQVELASLQVALVSAQVQLASGQVALVSGQVELATERMER